MPSTPGVDCHLVIDGIPYITANIGDGVAEAQRSVAIEALAPQVGNSQNVFDTLASDLSLLLPVGQGDFSDGIGSTDLELSPKGYERGENLMLTPQNTLLNGPVVASETFTASTAPTAIEGHLGGVIAAGLPNNYLGIGVKLYASINGTYSDLADTAQAITNIGGYSGKAVVCMIDSALRIYNGATLTAGTFYANRFFTLNGLPYIIYKDGRIYAAYINKPSAVSGVNEAGAIAPVRNWIYAIQYVLPGTPDYLTELSPLYAITKLANMQIRLVLPVKGYRGGEVMRRLYRTTTDELTIFYRIADTGVLFGNLTSYVDAVDDAGITGFAQLSMSAINNTSINVLTRGVLANNMAFPDTDPLFLPEDATTPSTGAQINNAQIFHDLQANEALMVGATNGLFLWNGVSRTFQTVRLFPNHPLNFKYMAVNHGVLYYTITGSRVRIWSPTSESILNGPWLVHFSTINDIRLTSAGQYVFISVSGINRYDSARCMVLYAFDGVVFKWSYRFNDTAGLSGANYPTGIMGTYVQRNDFLWYETLQALKTLKYISLDQSYSSYQTSGVLFRSAASDLDLPRLRKQIHGCMIRYLQLTTQTNTTLANAAVVGATTITVANPAGFAAGDWLCVKELNLDQAEYRKIANVTGSVITLTHTLGAPLLYAHAVGTKIARCGVIATIRNVFTDTLPVQDIEIGGPCDSADLFSLMRFPVPVYSYTNGLNIVWNTGTIMELQGWALLTALNPPYNGLIDANIRLQDYIKLPNNTRDTATAAQRKQNLIDAYNKGTVTVIDSLNSTRIMRVQRIAFDYEEPKERHNATLNMQATAHVRLVDVQAELMKQETLTLQGLSGQSRGTP